MIKIFDISPDTKNKLFCAFSGYADMSAELHDNCLYNVTIDEMIGMYPVNYGNDSCYRLTLKTRSCIIRVIEYSYMEVN